MRGLVFLDASFWISYRDERQEFHPQSKEILFRLLRERTTFVTTLPVLCEIHAHFSRSRIKQRVVMDDLFSNPIVHVAEVTPGDQSNALVLLRSHLDKSYSLCDALSFVVMRRMQIQRALSFDEHFRQFGGFTVLN